MEEEDVKNIIDAGMIAYLNYITRKLKKDPNYNPHPIVRAMTLALNGAEKEGKDGNYMGVSGDISEDRKSYKESYIVVIKKEKKTFRILSISDVSSGKELPISVCLVILKLSMIFDRFKNGIIPAKEAVKILNETLPKFNFVLFDNREWKKARDHLKELFEQQKVHLPSKSELINALLSIKEDTPWEDYHPALRSLISTCWLKEKYLGKNTIPITAPENVVEKHKIINLIKELIIGESSKYFKR